jgi:hypothetical protein
MPRVTLRERFFRRINPPMWTVSFTAGLLRD